MDPRIEKRLRAVSKGLLRTARRGFHKAPEQTMVMVFGVPRSGTNMLMEAFDRSRQCEVYHDTDRRAYRDYVLEDHARIEALTDTSPFEFQVFKPMLQSDACRQLLAEYAPSKGIWLVRNYPDVVNSHVKLWTGMPDAIGRIVAERHIDDWRGRGISDATYDVIRSVYRTDIDNPSACALYWYLRNTQLLEEKLLDDGNLRLIRYEQIASQPRETIADLFGWLGATFHPRVVKHIHARSVRRDAAPAVDAPIAELCEGLDEKLRTLEAAQR